MLRFRWLLLVQAVYAIALGFGMAIAPRFLPAENPELVFFGTARFIGLTTCGLAAAVWLLAAGPLGARRRLAAGFAAADAALALAVALQAPAVRAVIWAPIVGPLAAALAVAFSAVALTDSRSGRLPAGLAATPFVVQAALSFGLGAALTLFRWPFPDDLLTVVNGLSSLRLVGAVLGALGLALLALGDLPEGAERRRLAAGLLVADVGLGMFVCSEQMSTWNSALGLALVVLHLALALGFAAAVRAPRGPAPERQEEVSGLPWLGAGIWATHAAAGAVGAGAFLGVRAMAQGSVGFLRGAWLWGAALAVALPLAGGVGLFLIGAWRRRLELAGRDLSGLAVLLPAAGPPPALAAAARAELAALAPEAVAAPAALAPELAELRQGWLRRIGETAAQEERNRLARDLHDSIKQQLFGIQFQAAAAQERWASDPAGARAAVAEVRRGSQEAMLEMEALLDQLQPRALTLAGLVEALRLQCEVLRLRTGAQVALELGELPGDRLDARAPQELFRIAQEALANVGRHARAAGVTVWLGRREGALLLRVEDDGQGFEPRAGGSGMGLRNMRQRAAELAGSLAVESTPGVGTRIAVLLPLAGPPVEDPLAAAARAESWTPALCLAIYLAAAASAALVQPALAAVSAAAALAALAALSVASRLRLRRAMQGPGAGAAGARGLARLAAAAGRNRVYAALAAAWIIPWRRLSRIVGPAYPRHPIHWRLATVPPHPLWVALAVSAGALVLLELALLRRRAGGVPVARRAAALARALDRALSPVLERARWAAARRALLPTGPFWPRAAAAFFTLQTAYFLPLLSLYFLLTLPAGTLGWLRRGTALVVAYAAWLAIDARAAAR